MLQVPDPVGAVLDAQDAQVGEARQRALADHRRERVLDLAVLEQELLQRAGLERAVGTTRLPGLEVRGEGRERRVHAHGDPRLLHARPERIELGECDRARAPQPIGRRRSNEDRLRAAFEYPLEFGDGVFEDGQRDHRGAEDPVLVVERPLVVEPRVDGMDRRVGEVGIIRHRVLDEVGDGREHERAVHAELVHQLEARARLPERGDAVDRLAAHLAQAQTFGVVPRVKGHVRAGTGDAVERRVGDELGELPLHGQAGATAHLDELDVAGVTLREIVQPRRALVEVVVGVEHGKAGIGHGRSSLQSSIECFTVWLTVV